MGQSCTRGHPSFIIGPQALHQGWIYPKIFGRVKVLDGAGVIKHPRGEAVV